MDQDDKENFTRIVHHAHHLRVTVYPYSSQHYSTKRRFDKNRLQENKIEAKMLLLLQ